MLLNNISQVFSQYFVYPVHSLLISSRRVERISRLIAELIPENRLLNGMDVGCGNGDIAWSLQELNKEVVMIGLDTLPRNKSKIDVVQSDASHIPFEDNSFDFVILIDVLHHTNSPELLLSECKRVAKEFVIVKDHTCNSFWDRLCLSIMDWVGNKHAGVVLPYNYLSTLEWESLFLKLYLNPTTKIVRLALYSPMISWMFDRKLHFMVKLETSSNHLK